MYLECVYIYIWNGVSDFQVPKPHVFHEFCRVVRHGVLVSCQKTMSGSGTD